MLAAPSGQISLPVDSRVSQDQSDRREAQRGVERFQVGRVAGPRRGADPGVPSLACPGAPRRTPRSPPPVRRSWAEPVRPPWVAPRDAVPPRPPEPLVVLVPRAAEPPVVFVPRDVLGFPPLAPRPLGVPGPSATFTNLQLQHYAPPKVRVTQAPSPVLAADTAPAPRAGLKARTREPVLDSAHGPDKRRGPLNHVGSDPLQACPAASYSPTRSPAQYHRR